MWNDERHFFIVFQRDKTVIASSPPLCEAGIIRIKQNGMMEALPLGAASSLRRS
jgi:hypothetical protein